MLWLLDEITGLQSNESHKRHLCDIQHFVQFYWILCETKYSKIKYCVLKCWLFRKYVYLWANFFTNIVLKKQKFMLHKESIYYTIQRLSFRIFTSKSCLHNLNKLVDAIQIKKLPLTFALFFIFIYLWRVIIIKIWYVDVTSWNACIQQFIMS